MAELESVIEKRLIDQLCSDESQWTYRPDIRTEEQLWDNFKYILEQNNKAKLNDTPLSESEFAKIKNDLSHASFYDAGKWLIGENGKVYVHVQRGNETLHLVVMNNEHIAGGTSVYEVINQYQAFHSKEEEGNRDRRFDEGKQYGQIVTFQAHDNFKKAINDALMLYSRGGDGNPIAEDWDDVKESFAISLKAIRNLARTPEEIAGLSRKQKKAFIQLFRALDHDFAHLKSFTIYDDSVLDEWKFSESEYEDFAAMYKNVMEELKSREMTQTLRTSLFVMIMNLWHTANYVLILNTL